VLFLAGADPARDAADADLAARALDHSEFIVALDMFMTESVSRAHVILPVAAPYERGGTITGWDGVAREVRATVPPAGLAQSDWEILAQLAAGLGARFPQTIDALRAELRALAPARAEPQPHDVSATSRAKAGVASPAARPLIDDGTMMLGADELRASARAEVKA
jgi:anaerobic selenocysteine-containing dehydrogenase